MSAKLIIIDGIDKNREVKISKDSFTIGRNSESDLIFSDDLTSRTHAVISIDKNGRYSINDHKSRNGMFINGSKKSRHVLENGDIIQIGRNKLVFQLDSLPITGKVQIISKVSKISARSDKNFDSPPYRTPPQHFSLGEDEPTNISSKSAGVNFDPDFENLKFRYKALEQIAKAIGNVDNSQALIKASMDIILQSISFDKGGVFLFDESENRFNPYLVHTKDSEGFSLDDASLRKIILFFKNKQFTFIVDPENFQKVSKGETGTNAIVAALKTGKTILGFIYLDAEKRSHVFTNDEVELVGTIADEISVGFQKTTLESENKAMKIKLAELSKHLSPEIADAVSNERKSILENPFEAHEREVTVLFSDIEDFTTLSEKLTPSEIASLLNGYFSRMVEIIIANKGTVNKFIGDAVMALFGAPNSSGNDAENAVRAGIQMIEALSDFHKQIDKKKRFNIRIGINTGNVVAGTIGSEKRMEYTVLGDTVNCASRIENLAPANRIAVGELTHEKVKSVFACEPIGKINVKGRAIPINVFLVNEVRSSVNSL